MGHVRRTANETEDPSYAASLLDYRLHTAAPATRNAGTARGTLANGCDELRGGGYQAAGRRFKP
jgi:hypothetical protein